ncbi:MAG: YhcH/YjgK/YiaL family protein [Prevotella sp.]
MKLNDTKVYTTPYSKAAQKEAEKWVKAGSWRNGFTKASPDKTVNAADFQRQYTKNKAQWDALFAWVQSTDLTKLSAGKHPIPGTTMTASVQDDVNLPIEKRGTESHRKKIDFQYVVSGTEGFALIDHNSSKPNCNYDAKKDVIHYDYDKAKAWVFPSTKNCFNIFFPGDWHIAKVSTKKKDQHFRVVVVKVDYKD